MGLDWQPVRSLASVWEANVAALAMRDAQLAERLRQHAATVEYVVAGDGQRLSLASSVDGRIDPLPNPVPPASARDIARKLFPGNRCSEPVMIAGLDQGWLWNTLYALECNTPRTPGHRPPLYFLARDIERLWLVMHLHDWSTMLSDPRIRLYCGADAVEQCRADMHAAPHIPWAKLCVTVDPRIWPAGVTVDSLWQSAHQAANARMQQLSRRIEAIYAGTDIKSIARRMRGETLRILGITSRFTTFLKHSMSDWLDAMAALGHETRMVLESADHEITNPIYFAEQIVEFQPDLILMIDHYRGEIAGLPRQIPCVMWVQDNLPSIFSPQAGAAQGPRDYCIGFGRLNLRDSCGYPEQRFMPAQVGVNETRFCPREFSAEERDAHACDVSFVSHASTPATVLLTEQLNRADATGKKLLIDIFEQMRAVYDAGGAITQPLHIRRMIDSSIQRLKAAFDEPIKRHLHDFFNQRVNNALFRHQTLTWLADMDVNLHLYGRGWEQHPRLAKYARGIACNQTQLSAIYQASRINMQITPFGAVHQRLFEGLACGGFFLLRHVSGDEIERVYRQLHDWCIEHQIQSGSELAARATPHVRQLLEQARQLVGVDPLTMEWDFIDVLKLSADGQYIRSAATVWEEYDRVAFRSAAELRERVNHFLANDDDRRATADSMRRVVLERFTYRSISERLLNFMADDLSRDVFRAAAA